MARIHAVAPSELPDEFRDLPLHQNFQRVYANSPAAMRAFMGVSGYVRNEGGLDARLRELAVLQVGCAARSAYVFTHHVKVALSVGITPDEIASLVSGNPDSPLLSTPLERAVLALARDVTARRDVPDATFGRVRVSLGDRQLMNLLFVIAHYIGMAALIATLRIELEGEYRQYLTFLPANLEQWRTSA